MASEEGAEGMSHDDVFRHAARLSGYSRKVVSPFGALSALLFMEDVEFPPTWYELVNRFDATKFVPLRGQAEYPDDYPHDRHGLTRWTLRPREAAGIDDLDALAFHIVSRCCVLDTIVMKRTMKADRLKYRFVMVAEEHAHCGVIVFTGEAVRGLLARRKR